MANKKVFLSPSNQYDNTWIKGNTNEMEQNIRLADLLQAHLERCGITVVRADAVRPSERINCAVGCDFYMPLHTNAFNEKTRGCRLFVYNNKAKYTAKKNAEALNCIYEFTENLAMDNTPRKYYDFANWFELTNADNAKIPSVYAESIFHDNEDDCDWWFLNIDRLAVAYCKGICKFLGVEYEKPTDVFYRVQVGAYKRRSYAERMMNDLKALGYDAFIVEVKKEG